MRHVYQLPADEAALWPRGEEIYGHNRLHLGRRILDSGGLRVCWGDGQHWAQVDEPTSPRGSVWHLINVCWLSVHATVLAPPPGCYAAFFRVRQPVPKQRLLEFSAEWKVAATTAVRPTDEDVGFLKRTGLRRPPALRQECEASASWTHCKVYGEDNPGGWLLLHIGTIMVRESSEAQKRAAAAEGRAANTTGGGPGASGAAAEAGAGVRGRHVSVSFGGENQWWAKNLEVDFAAIVPLRLSWDIERVLMIGNRKGDVIGRGLESAEPEQADDEKLGQGVVEPAPGAVACSRDGCSPLSRLPGGVMLLVLEFSQPTLVRPQEDGIGRASGTAEGVQEDTGRHWNVF